MYEVFLSSEDGAECGSTEFNTIEDARKYRDNLDAYDAIECGVVWVGGTIYDVDGNEVE